MNQPVTIDSQAAEAATAETVTTAGPPAAEAGGILTIDLAAIEANWRALGRRAMPSECAAVVKADGYGLGLAPVAKRLAKAGCKSFFVADLAEARTCEARVARVRALRLEQPSRSRLELHGHPARADGWDVVFPVAPRDGGQSRCLR